MKKILIILLLLPIFSYSQKKMGKEEFVNQVYKSFVDSTFEQYYLANQCYNLNIDITDSIQIIKNFGEYVPNEVLNQLILEAINDSSLAYWNSEEINGFICVSEDSSSHLIRKPFTVETKWIWSKERKRKEALEQIQKQMNNPMILQYRTVYQFSKPIFSNDNNYVIIRMGYICSGECGESCIILFKKSGKKWKYINKTSCINS